MDYAKKVDEDLFNQPEIKDPFSYKEAIDLAISQFTPPKEGGEVKVRISTDPRMLSPIISNEAISNRIIGYVYDSLIIRDPEKFEWLPWLAHSWEIKDMALIDGKDTEGYYDPERNLFYPGNGEITALSGKIKKIAYNTYKVKNKIYKGKLKKLFYTTKIIPNTGKGYKVEKVKKHVVFLFYIRENIKWQDGFSFSVDDVLFSFNMINNPYTDAAHLRGYYRDIKSLKKIDNYTIKFLYNKPYFLSLSFCGGIPIIPKHRYNPAKFKGDTKSLAKYFNSHPDNWKPIGSGAYKFSKWEKGQYITLIKNHDYWARKAKLPYFKKEQPYLEKIRFIVISNRNTSLKELSGKNIDADFGIVPSMWKDSRTLSKNFTKNFARAKYIIPLYTQIGWNLDRPYFKDYRVRQALTYLIPKRKILKEIHKSLGKVVTGPFFTEGPVYDKKLKPLYYDPVKARRLLKEAGWVDHDGDGVRDKDGVKFQFEYLIHNAREYHQKIADIIKESLEEAGIIVNIRIIDWTVFAKTVNERNFDAVRFAWGTGIDGDPFQIWHSSQMERGGSNYIGYKNKEVDKILEDARNIFDPLKRWEKYRALHHIFYKEQPYSFLFSFYTLGFYNKKFRGVKFYSSGYNFSEWHIK